MILILDSCGNIDYNQDPNKSLYGVKPNAVRCIDFEMASNLCRKYIETHNLGAGNWGGNAGIILDDEQEQIARVSYNGRVWDNNDQRNNNLKNRNYELH